MDKSTNNINYYANTGLYFLGGSISAVCGILNGYPLDTIKTRIQSSYFLNNNFKQISSIDLIKEIYKKNGIRGFYRGIEAPIVSYSLGQTINFGVNGNIQNYMKKQYIKNNKWNGYFDTKDLIWMGATSGFCSSLVITPNGRIKTRLQNVKTEKGTFNYFYNDVLKKDGLFGKNGLYKGWCATILRDVPRISIYFTTYNKLIQYWKPFNGKDKHSPIQHFVSGALAGQFSWLIAYPFDIIKTNIQTNSESIKIKEAFNKIYKNNGLKGFYRGYFFIWLEAMPLHGTIFYVNHLWKEHFNL